MEYDQTEIPATYDRGRDHGPKVLALWMDAVAAHVAGATIRTILDLGCGTGRFSDGLAVRFNAEVVGVDPSAKMLEQARAKPRDGRVRYHQGRAESIPLPSQSVELVFLSMSLHHFDDRLLAARECRRVLSPSGRVFVRTGTREQIPSYPYVPFFPSSVAIMEEVLPDCRDVQEAFEAAGFHKLSAQLIPQTIAADWAAYADKLSTGADSVLARLSRGDFEQGLAAVRRHGEHVQDQRVMELIDFFVFG